MRIRNIQFGHSVLFFVHCGEWMPSDLVLAELALGSVDPVRPARPYGQREVRRLLGRYLTHRFAGRYGQAAYSSLSDQEDIVGIGIDRHVALGLEIQRVQLSSGCDDLLVDMLLDAGERKLLDHIPAPERGRYLHTRWAIKQACLKAQGRQSGEELESILVDRRDAAVEMVCGGERTHWRVALPRLDERHVCAIVRRHLPLHERAVTPGPGLESFF